MDQEKFGKFIKKIRKDNNLTQKEFADKYNVTYQAVSKWENGKNMPDIALIKQISEDFNISLEELYNGEYKKKSKKIFIIIYIFVILSIIITIINIFSSDDFQFKTLSSDCSNFTIKGSLAYNDSKSAIYISDIEYCGGDDTNKYKNIECILYEQEGDTSTTISTYKYEGKESINLEEFLKDVSFKIDDYESTCSKYEASTIYLKLNAKDDDKTLTYEIPLKLDDNC